MDKEVLHVNDYKNGLFRVDYAAPVVSNAIVSVNGQFPIGSAGKVEAFGLRDVQPLVVVAAKGDRLRPGLLSGSLLWDWNVLNDLDSGRCHVTVHVKEEADWWWSLGE